VDDVDLNGEYWGRVARSCINSWGWIVNFGFKYGSSVSVAAIKTTYTYEIS
jgi:hypothetical protein